MEKSIHSGIVNGECPELTTFAIVEDKRGRKRKYRNEYEANRARSRKHRALKKDHIASLELEVEEVIRFISLFTSTKSYLKVLIILLQFLSSLECIIKCKVRNLLIKFYTDFECQ